MFRLFHQKINLVIFSSRITLQNELMILFIYSSSLYWKFELHVISGILLFLSDIMKQVEEILCSLLQETGSMTNVLLSNKSNTSSICLQRVILFLRNTICAIHSLICFIICILFDAYNPECVIINGIRVVLQFIKERFVFC